MVVAAAAVGGHVARNLASGIFLCGRLLRLISRRTVGAFRFFSDRRLRLPGRRRRLALLIFLDFRPFKTFRGRRLHFTGRWWLTVLAF